MKNINFILISAFSIFNIIFPTADISEIRKKETTDQESYLLRYEFITSRKPKRRPPHQDLDTAIDVSSGLDLGHQEEVKTEDGYLLITRAEQRRPTKYNFIETATLVWVWQALATPIATKEIVTAGAGAAVVVYSAVDFAFGKITGRGNSNKSSNNNNKNDNRSNNKNDNGSNNKNDNGSNNDNDPKKPKNHDPILPSDKDKYAPKSGFTADPAKPNGNYVNNPKHHQNSHGNISKAPKDGQACLNKSVETIKKDVRVAVEDKKYVVLREHRPGEFHGYVVENWNDLHWTEQHAFCEGGLVKNAQTGKLVK